MENKQDETKKVILGLLLGVVGAGAFYCVRAIQERKTPVLKKVGKTISEIGEMLEDFGDINVKESLEKKIPSGTDIIHSLTDWVDTGMTLWKKFKKG